MPVALCSAATGNHLALLDLAEPSYRAYAARHHFDVHITRTLPADRPASWFKLKLIEDLWFDYQTVVWVDADAIIFDSPRSILDDTDPSRPLWMARHHLAGHSFLFPNCGVLVASYTPLLHDFFREVWRQERYIDHPWWEQAAVLDLLGYHDAPGGGLVEPDEPTEWTPLVGWLGTEWNSMHHDPHPHPVIEHFSGMAMTRRIELMTEAANRAGIR